MFINLVFAFAFCATSLVSADTSGLRGTVANQTVVDQNESMSMMTPSAGTTCDGGEQIPLSGDGAPMQTTRGVAGRSMCMWLCERYAKSNGVGGCCRYAEGIPPWEATPTIPESDGARCWFRTGGHVVVGDPTTSGVMTPTPPEMGTTCVEGNQQALSGDGAPMRTTVGSAGRSTCLSLCQHFAEAHGHIGCCRYAEGIPPWEATPTIPVAVGARCWFRIGGHVVTGDSTTFGVMTPPPPAKGTTCAGGRQEALSGDGAPMTTTKDALGRATCSSLCANFAKSNAVSGCCRYAEGIPPWEATPAIPVDEGARCWFGTDGHVVDGDLTTFGVMMPAPPRKGTTCAGGEQTALSGDGAPMTTTKGLSGQVRCLALCVRFVASHGMGGCCRYAEGIPPWEATPGIPESEGARCWFRTNGFVVNGDSTTFGEMFANGTALV